MLPFHFANLALGIYLRSYFASFNGPDFSPHHSYGGVDIPMVLLVMVEHNKPSKVTIGRSEVRLCLCISYMLV